MIILIRIFFNLVALILVKTQEVNNVKLLYSFNDFLEYFLPHEMMSSCSVIDSVCSEKPQRVKS